MSQKVTLRTVTLKSKQMNQIEIVPDPNVPRDVKVVTTGKAHHLLQTKEEVAKVKVEAEARTVRTARTAKIPKIPKIPKNKKKQKIRKIQKQKKSKTSKTSKKSKKSKRMYADAPSSSTIVNNHYVFTILDPESGILDPGSWIQDRVICTNSGLILYQSCTNLH